MANPQTVYLQSFLCLTGVPPFNDSADAPNGTSFAPGVPLFLSVNGAYKGVPNPPSSSSNSVSFGGGFYRLQFNIKGGTVTKPLNYLVEGEDFYGFTQTETITILNASLFATAFKYASIKKITPLSANNTGGRLNIYTYLLDCSTAIIPFNTLSQSWTSQYQVSTFPSSEGSGNTVITPYLTCENVFNVGQDANGMLPIFPVRRPAWFQPPVFVAGTPITVTGATASSTIVNIPSTSSGVYFTVTWQTVNELDSLIEPPYMRITVLQQGIL